MHLLHISYEGLSSLHARLLLMLEDGLVNDVDRLGLGVGDDLHHQCTWAASGTHVEAQHITSGRSVQVDWYYTSNLV